MQTQRIRAATLVVAGVALAVSCTQSTPDEPVTPPAAPPAAPSADFAASTTAGNAPLMVTFMDMSTGATSWLWDFGDGQVSAAQNPTHEYAAPGVYTVKLTATGPGGTDVMTKVGLIAAAAAIGDTSLETQTAGSPPAAPWTIFAGVPMGLTQHVVRSVNDGDPADNGMPTHGFKWLEVSSFGTDTVPPPVVPFTAGTEGGSTGPAGASQTLRYSATHTVLQFDVCFVNGEGGPDLTFNDWMSVDISDGTTSNNLFFRDTFSGALGTSPIHSDPITPIERVAVDLAQLYPGSTTSTDFTLTVSIANAGDGAVSSWGYLDNLRLLQPPASPLAADFIVSQRVGGVGTPFRFTDMSAGTPKSRIWDFGDGTASTEEEPDKVYSSESSYDVTLYVSSPGSSSVERKEAFVVVDDSACETAAFQVITSGGLCQGTGELVTFQNDSVNADSYVWDFGDGSLPLMTMSSGNVTHTYNTPGDYQVTLTAIGPCFGELMSPPAQVTDTQTMDIVDAPSAVNLSFTMTTPFGTDVSCTPPGFAQNKAVYRQETVRFTASNSNPDTGPLTYSWNFGDATGGNGSVVDKVYNVAAVSTVTLTATNCAGSAQIQRTIKVVQDWQTVYGFINSGGCNSSVCHDGDIAMNLLGQGTAYTSLVGGGTGANMTSCTDGGGPIPAKRVNPCNSGISNDSGSGVIWALSNNVCGNGVMSVNCGCLDPASAEAGHFRDWIDFGAPNN